MCSFEGLRKPLTMIQFPNMKLPARAIDENIPLRQCHHIQILLEMTAGGGVLSMDHEKKKKKSKTNKRNHTTVKRDTIID